MKIEKIVHEKLDEFYYKINHDSGLTIYVMPKPGYASSYAVFGTKYGSIDTCFRLEGEEEFTTVPEGIAHFLEHKLFESEELDAFQLYAQTGANANAYTSFDRTCYIFACTGDFKGSLKILLDFVQSPYFTQKTVEKEQGIIGQEIKMTQDNPGWALLFNLLECLYHNHPVKIEIAGTVDSIAKIDADLLYKCYNTFYSLSNMTLCVAGNVSVDDVLEIADAQLKKSEPKVIERTFPEEPDEIVCDYKEVSLPVSSPLFMLGFKEKMDSTERSLKERIAAKVLMEILCGDSSELYKELFNENLINTTFSFEYFNGFGHSACFFEGESNDPGKVRDRIIEGVRKLRENGIDEKEFIRVKKALYGAMVMEYNDVDDLANSLAEAHFDNIGFFDDFKVIEELTVEDVKAVLDYALKPEYCALSVISPKE